MIQMASSKIEFDFENLTKRHAVGLKTIRNKIE